MKKNKNKDGFLLVEVVIAITLFSSIITVLGTAFFQITKSLQSITRLHFFDTRIFTIQNLLEKEIAGVHIPSLVALSSSEGADQAENIALSDQKNKQGEWPEKAFFVEHYRDGNLKEMRFITSNAVAVYNTAKPHCVLVIYELVKNTTTDTFSLQRTEATVFDVQGSVKKTGPFVVAEGIKSLSVKMYGEKESQEEKQKKGDKNKDDKEKKTEKKRKEFEEKTEWNSDDYKNKEKENEEQKQAQNKNDDENDVMRPLPAYIAFTLVLQDALSDKTCPVEFICAPLYGIEKIVIPVKNSNVHNDEIQQKMNEEQKQKTEPSHDQAQNNEPLPVAPGIEKIQQIPLSSSLQSKVDGYKVKKIQQQGILQ